MKVCDDCFLGGNKVQRYVGDLKPKNASVLLIDGQSEAVHFYDRSFSVNTLNALR